jgi:hypothetical protein
MLVKWMEKGLRNILVCTNAMQLWLSVDCHCPKYKGKVSKHKGKRDN